MADPWTRDQVLVALRATFGKRGLNPGLSEESDWRAGFVILFAEDDDAPFLERGSSKPSGDLASLLKRSGWTFHAYDEELFFLAPSTMSAPTLDPE